MNLNLRCGAKQYRHLQKLFGSCLNLPNKHYIARHILQLLKIAKTTTQEQDISCEDYKYNYAINVPLWVYTQYGVSYITPSVTALINKYLLESFQFHFYLRLHELVYVAHPKKKILDALYQLSSEWDLDEDITIDALKKDYFRYRKKRPEIFSKKNTFYFVPDVATKNDPVISDSLIRARIPSGLKSAFQRKCKKLNLDCSSVLREMIQSFNETTT